VASKKANITLQKELSTVKYKTKKEYSEIYIYRRSTDVCKNFTDKPPDDHTC